METATDTRDQSYELTHAEGKVHGRQKQILSFLMQHPDHALSNMEISRASGLPINVVTGRMFELREAGLVCSKGRRHCSLTQRLVHVWGLSGKSQEDIPGALEAGT